MNLGRIRSLRLLLGFVVVTINLLAGAISVYPNRKDQNDDQVTDASKDEAAKDENKDDENNDDSSTDPLKIKGPIQKIQEPLAQIVKLRWDKGRLETSFPQSYDEAESPIDLIRNEFGYGDGSSYGSPDYRLGFGDSKVVGYLERARKNKSNYRTSISLREISKPKRSLSISTNEKNDFTAIIRAADSAYLLRIRQQEDGQFSVQEIKGTEVFSVIAADFNSFMELHRSFAVDRLLPAMEVFGIGKLISPYNKDVQENVLKQLLPLAEEQRTKSEELVVQLNSDQYQLREDATEKMRSEFPENLELLTHVFLSTHFSPEVRSRARQVIIDHAEPEEIDMLDFLTSSRLLDEISYLVWLLDTELEPSQRQHVIDRFQQVSKLKITPDSPEWSTWVASQPFAKPVVKNSEETMPTVDFKPMLVNGVLQKANPETGKIIRIQFENDGLALDREHWAKPFGGKSIEDLTDELKKEFSDRNIPESWLNEGGHSSMSQTGHAQVLFELMYEVLNGESSDFVDEFDSSGQSNGWAMSFEAGKVRTRMNVPKATGVSRRRSNRKNNDAKKPDIKPFHFFIEEMAEPFRAVAIDESRDSFSINLVCEPKDISIQLIQNESGVLLQDIRGLHVLALQEPTFRQLYEKNVDYFKNEFFPLMQYMGMQLAPDVAEPLAAALNEK